MAKLYFRAASMNSGKSIMLQAVAFNYEERGMVVRVLKPNIDTKSPKVSSRIGLERSVDWAVEPEDSILDLYSADSSIDCILVDEAQFLTPDQIDELFEIAVIHDIPVIAYGLRTDFRTHSFPGSMRLLEVAHSIEELKTICSCGKKAIFNARKRNNKFVSDGDSVAIDGEENITYESVCGACFNLFVGKPKNNFSN